MKIHIRFNGAGGHYSYLLGIAEILQKYYNLESNKHNIIYSGYSAGCIPALLCCLNLDINYIHNNLNIPLLETLKLNTFKSFFSFIPFLKYTFLTYLNNISTDLYIKTNNKFYCNLTHIPTFKNHIFNKFYSNEDLIDCMMASGNFPLYNNKFLYKFRNNNYIDGGLILYTKTDTIFEDPNYYLIELKCNKYRTIPSSFIFISSCKDYNTYLYELGKYDAMNNLHDFNILN